MKDTHIFQAIGVERIADEYFNIFGVNRIADTEYYKIVGADRIADTKYFDFIEADRIADTK